MKKLDGVLFQDGNGLFCFLPLTPYTLRFAPGGWMRYAGCRLWTPEQL